MTMNLLMTVMLTVMLTSSTAGAVAQPEGGSANLFHVLRHPDPPGEADAMAAEAQGIHGRARREGGEEEGAGEGGGCILYMDNRKLNFKKPANAYSYLENRGNDLPYWISSKIINRLYAQRHGYKFVAGSPRGFFNKANPRAPAWYKVLFLKQQLQRGCRWALYLDSDAYFRMEDHSLSLERWLGLLTTPHYFDEIQYTGIDFQYQTWFPEDPIRLVDPPASSTSLIGLFPRNGHTNCFFPENMSCLDFVNSGVIFLRNSTLTHEFLDEWYNDPTPDKDFINRPWEQHRLHAILPKYRANVAIVPNMEMTGNMGRNVRHYWSDLDREDPTARSRSLKMALLGTVTRLNVEEEKATGQMLWE